MPSSNPDIFTVRTAPDYGSAVVLWVLLVLWKLFRIWYTSQSLADLWILLPPTIIAALSLLIPLLWEPLYFRVDTQAATISYGWVRLPWKKELSMQGIHSEIIDQVSHSGKQRYFLLFQDGKQLLHVRASTRWPLATLRALQQHMTSHN